MKILIFIKEYWGQILFVSSFFGSLIMLIFAVIEGIKCSLRNDILTIYDRCNEKKKITYYELEAVLSSFKIYKILRGNTFVEEIVNHIKKIKIIE